MYIESSIVDGHGQSSDQIDKQIPSNSTQLTSSAQDAAQDADADTNLADIPSEVADFSDEILKAILLDDDKFKNLLRLYRTGANRYMYTAEEDDMDDVSIIITTYITSYCDHYCI